MFNRHHLPQLPKGTSVDLEVIEVTGWDEAPVPPGPWVAPSPNLPTAQAALCYPGTGLFEATNLSEGRGTTRPFTLLGAPWIDHRWADAVRNSEHPGVIVREASFSPLAVPGFDRHAEQRCHGLELHVVDPAALDAVMLGADLLVQARRLYPEFGHRGDDWRWLALMTGSDRFRRGLVAGADAQGLTAPWLADQREWDDIVGDALPSSS